MEKPILINTIANDSTLDKCKNMQIELMESPYAYKGKKVPRVTSILSDMLAEEYLMTWANNVGLYQHKKHTEYQNKATMIGSNVHNAIERYIQGKELSDFQNIRVKTDREKAIKSFNAFLDWWNVIEQNQHEVLLEEEPLITSYCGGTLDLLMEINRNIFLIDFKTSSQLGFKYYLQLAAYRRMLYETLGIICDGTVLLRLDKNNGRYEEQVLLFSRYDDLKFMNQCDSAFISLLYAYYNRFTVESALEERMIRS